MKKDQFIIANIADLEQSQAVCEYARYMAQRLRKGLILLHICDKRYATEDAAQAEAQLQALQQSIHYDQVSYCVLSGTTKETIETIPTLLNGVLIVTAIDPSASSRSPLYPKRVLKDFSTCKTAYLTIRTTAPAPHIAHVALTIDFHRESKEKLIWSSYFARFGGSSLHVLYHDYKDEGLRQKWYNNMLFLHKFYTSLGITFAPHIVAGKAANVDADALPFIKESNFDLLVSVTTNEKDLLDSLLGTQEQRTIQNSEEIPVLFLNPRDDLYVLCD